MFSFSAFHSAFLFVRRGWLLQRGFRVKALSRSKEKSRELLGDAANLEHVEGDIISKGKNERLT